MNCPFFRVLSLAGACLAVTGNFSLHAEESAAGAAPQKTAPASAPVSPTETITALIDQKKYPEALEAAEKFVANEPGNAEAFLFRARAKANLTDFSGALVDASKAIELKGDFSAAYSLRSQLRKFTGDIKGAAQDCDKAIQLDPRNDRAYFARAVLNLNVSSNAGALSTSEIAGFARNTDDTIADLTKAIEINPTENYYTIRATVLYGKREYEKAAADYRQAVELAPGSAQAHSNYGLALIEIAGGEAGALAAFEKAIELDATFSLAWKNKAALLKNLNRYDEALLAVDRALRLNPKDADAYYVRGQIYLYTGRNSEAIVEFDKALQLNPQNAEAFLKRSSAKSELGNHAGAIEDATRALQIGSPYLSDIAYAHVVRANVYLSTKDFSSAIDDANRALLINEKYADAYLARSGAYLNTDKLDEGIRDVRKAIELNPGSALSYSVLAAAEAKQGNAGAAHKAAEKSRALNEKDKRILVYIEDNLTQMVLFLVKDADYGTAMNELDKAIRETPKNVELLLTRAKLNIKNEKYTDAKLDLEYVRAIDLNNKEAEALLEKMKPAPNAGNP